MSSIDEEIRKRLEKLRASDSTNPTPSGSLSGASTSGLFPKEKKKSAAEQVEDLLGQLAGETCLDARINKGKEDVDAHIRARLERLKSREGCDFVSNKSAGSDSKSDGLEDEEFFKAASCTQLMTHDFGSDRMSEDSDSEESDPLDEYCSICGQTTPTLICIECDSELFCPSCYKEFHYGDDANHRTEPYKKTNNRYGLD